MAYLYGPWYECQGPSAKDVRIDQFNKYSIFINEKIGFDSNSVKAIILKHIPDTMKDFGSYRGYATFGLKDTIKQKINRDILLKRRVECQKIIKKWYNRYKKSC